MTLCTPIPGFRRDPARHHSHWTCERKKQLPFPPALHDDVEIARALVECLTARFQMEVRDIRCTSVHPYRLRAGENADSKLREEVPRAEVVLGLITPLTNESTYVMFELGAAWGNNVWTCPLLVRGATAENLPAPMHSRHPIVLCDKDDCYGILSLADELKANTDGNDPEFTVKPKSLLVS